MAIHDGHRQRVKQEFLSRGTEGWDDHRLLELLLFYAIPQGDVNGLSHTLIERFGNLAGVLDASVDELKKVPGVGEHSAVLLHLMHDLAGTYFKERCDLRGIVRTTADAADLLAPYFFGARNEMVYILCLDGKGKALGVRKISEGSISSADVSFRRITEEALGLRAAAIYLAHNHISNLALPSQQDWATTDAVRQVLAPMQIEVIDHLIFVDGDAVSLSESARNGSHPAFRWR